MIPQKTVTTTTSASTATITVSSSPSRSWPPDTHHVSRPIWCPRHRPWAVHFERRPS